MKLKHIMTTLGLALVLGVGVGISHGVKEVKAEVGDDNYYLTGKFGGVEHWNDYVAAPATATNLGELLNQPLKKGDTFKFKLKGSWDNALTFDKFNASAGAYDAFRFEKDTDNTYCAVDGTYNFFIYQDGENVKVSVEFADSYAATYSYVVTQDSELDHIHLFNDTFSLRDWNASPTVNGQAYDIKFVDSGYDYYGLYRVDDRILSGWDGFIMKNAAGSKQTADLSREVGHKEEVYFVGDALQTFVKESVYYQAAEYLYNLVSHRGAAEYDNFSFAYSICATSVADATALIAAYDGFNAYVKGALANATVRTYSLEGEHGEENKTYVTVASLVDALRLVVAKQSGSNPANGSVVINSNNSALVIILVSSMSLIAISALFIIRRRRAMR